MFQRHSRALASERSWQKLRCQNALLRTPFLSWKCIAVEGTHGNDGLLLGKPPEEPDQPITENSLLEVLDGIVMMYNLSVHQQLGKVSSTCCAGIHFPNVCASTPTLFSAYSVTVCALSFCQPPLGFWLHVSGKKTPYLLLKSAAFQMVGVSDDVNEYAMALKDTEEKISRCPKRVSVSGFPALTRFPASFSGRASVSGRMKSCYPTVPASASGLVSFS